MRSIILAFLAFASAAGAQQVSTDAKQAPTGRYALEVRHSQVLFAISHQGLTDFNGRFDRLSGSLNFDAAEPKKSVVSIVIDTDSINTPSQALDLELKSAKTFDTQNFPTATFVSTSVVRTGATTGKVTGDLKIKNVTRPITLDVTFNGGRLDGMSNAYAIGFHATVTIKRSDFHLTDMPWSPYVGDDVKLIIEAPFQLQKG